MSVKTIRTRLSVASMVELKREILNTERKLGSFLLQVFSDGDAIGFYILPEKFDIVQEFLVKLKAGDDEREGEDHG